MSSDDDEEEDASGEEPLESFSEREEGEADMYGSEEQEDFESEVEDEDAEEEDQISSELNHATSSAFKQSDAHEDRVNDTSSAQKPDDENGDADASEEIDSHMREECKGEPDGVLGE